MEENIDDEIMFEFPPYELEALTKEEILSDTVIDYLIALPNGARKIRKIEEVKEKAREFKITNAFNKIYKERDKELGIKEQNNVSDNQFALPEMTDMIYNTGRYEITDSGEIFEVIPDVGKIRVSYHLIFPIEKFENLEDNSIKIKLAFYVNNKWKYVIVDKSVISSSQSIVKLSDVDIGVTSENAKFLVKYLAEMEYANEDKIPRHYSVSRLGWFGDDVLIPYSDKYEIDNEKDMPNIKEKFGETGQLDEWVSFLKERRKYNSVSRITMAAAVSSILLKKIKQPGFTLHIWGESEYGKTVASMVGQSIFGNPAQGDSKGIGINFNFTPVGLEYKLNTFNNIPLFINEMQHQKDAKDYDKILFLISEGKGKTRSTKTGGV